MWHKEQIRAFWKHIYHEKPVMTFNSIVDWIAIQAEPKIVFKEEYNKRFIMDIAVEANLPILVKQFQPLTYKSKTYFEITDFDSLHFIPKKHYSFAKLVDFFYNDFEHSQPEDFLFYKLALMASIVTRTNFRIEAPRAFGKTFPFKMLSELGEKVSVVSPHSDSSIRMRLNSKVLVLDEISATNTEQLHIIQQFLLTTGAGDDFYEAPVRGSAQWGTQDVYKIFDLSLVIIHNPRDYYEGIGQSYFEDMFTPAVLDRFLKLNLTGELKFTGGQPKDILTGGKVDAEYIEKLKNWLETLNYYKLNWKNELIQSGKLEWMNYLRFEKLSERKKYQITFLLAMLALYTPDSKLFTILMGILNEKLETNSPNMLTLFEYVTADPAINDVPIQIIQGDELNETIK